MFKYYKISIINRTTCLLHMRITRHVSTTVNQVHEHSTESTIKSFNEIPGPKGLPVIGTLFEYLKNDGWGFKHLYKMTEKRRQEFGPIYKEKVGNTTFVGVASAEDAEKVLRAEGKYPTRNPLIPIIEARKALNAPLGIVLSNGEEWKRYRSVMDKKMMRPKEVACYSDRINEVANDLIDCLKANRNSNQIVTDIEALINKYPTEAIGTVLFERRLGMLNEVPDPKAIEFYQSIRLVLEHANSLISIPPFIFKYVFTKKWKELVKWADVSFKYPDEIVEEKRQQIERDLKSNNTNTLEKKVDFLTYVISTNRLNRREANVAMIELFFGGVDTTANTILWTLYNLGKNPDVQQKLLDEVTNILKDTNDPDADLLEKMPYLRACFKETLRMQPIAFALPRIIAKDLVLSGYRVPAKTLVLNLSYVMGRDESIFINPTQYMPERWLKGSDCRVFNRFQVLPFGFGPRMCIGKRVAEMEMHTLLAKIIRNFEIQTFNENENTLTLRVVMAPTDKMMIALKDRVY